MKIKIVLIVFAIFGCQIAFSQESKTVVVDSMRIVPVDLLQQKTLEKEAIKEREKAAKALKDAEKDRKKAQKELDKAEKVVKKQKKKELKQKKFGSERLKKDKKQLKK